MTKAEPDVLEGKVSSRALFLYFRGGNAEEQLKSFPEFTLWLPKRGSRRLKVEGEEVGGAETSLPLRREKGGTYVCVSSLECTGALPFEIGLKSGAGEEQRWMAGELRHHAGEEGRAGGWGMMLSTTALGGGPVLRDLRCDVEVLICCDVAPGQPACLSAHASFPTARRTSCRARVARRSSLDVISEEEKVRLSHHSLRSLRKAPELKLFWQPHAVRTTMHGASRLPGAQRERAMRQGLVHGCVRGFRVGPERRARRIHGGVPA